MRRLYFWLTLEGIGLFLALGGILEGMRSLSVPRFDAALGWFSLWAGGIAFHEWRKECRRNAAADELAEPSEEDE
jgi:hypothetical protein